VHHFNKETDSLSLIPSLQINNINNLKSVCTKCTVCANEPLKALKHFKDDDYYDLVVLDIRMSEINGIELYYRLKYKKTISMKKL
jgi:CheY-like chemotaxis protein